MCAGLVGIVAAPPVLLPHRRVHCWHHCSLVDTTSVVVQPQPPPSASLQHRQYCCHIAQHTAGTAVAPSTPPELWCIASSTTVCIVAAPLYRAFLYALYVILLYIFLPKMLSFCFTLKKLLLFLLLLFTIFLVPIKNRRKVRFLCRFLFALFMPLLLTFLCRFLWRFYSLLLWKKTLLLFCCFYMLLFKLIWCSVIPPSSLHI
jgi:hypothetical protein